MSSQSPEGVPQVRVLGSIEVGSLAPGPRLRRLLAALVAHAGDVLSVDALTEAVWGDDQPAAPDAALHNLVSRLRTALREIGDLAPEVLARPPGYLLHAARRSHRRRAVRTAGARCPRGASRPARKRRRRARPGLGPVARPGIRRAGGRGPRPPRGSPARRAALLGHRGACRGPAAPGSAPRRRTPAPAPARDAALARARAGTADARSVRRRTAGGRARGLRLLPGGVGRRAGHRPCS